MNKKIIIITSVLICVFLLISIVYSELVVYDTATLERHNAFGNMLGYRHQRSLGYANGLYWVFYASYGSGIGYATSPDGENFTEQSIIHSGNYGRYFDLDFIGTDLHMCYGAGGVLTYRRGILNANSSITWYASEQTISTPSGDANVPSIEVDENNYVYIGFMDNGVSDYPYVVKSGNNDGTWGVTPSPFPYKLKNLGNSGWAVKINCVGFNTVVSYSYIGAPIYAKLFSDGSFGVEDSTTNTVKGDGHDAIDNKTDIVFHWLDAYNDMETAIYDISSEVFVEEETIYSSTNSDVRPSATFDTITENMYIFYSDYPSWRHFYYMVRYPNATYTASQDFGSDAGCVSGVTQKAFTHTMGEYGEAMGFAYLWLDSGQVYVRFIGLDFIDREYTPPPPPTPDPFDWGNVKYMLALVIFFIIAIFAIYIKRS